MKRILIVTACLLPLPALAQRGPGPCEGQIAALEVENAALKTEVKKLTPAPEARP